MILPQAQTWGRGTSEAGGGASSVCPSTMLLMVPLPCVCAQGRN
jgi:hypothetical protein